MDQRGDEIHTTATEATGASREGVVRWVLIIGLVLIVVVFAVIVMVGTGSQRDGGDSQTSVSRKIQEDQATEDSRGEPTMPGYGSSPSASATPGDAPAGDPTNTAQ